MDVISTFEVTPENEVTEKNNQTVEPKKNLPLHYGDSCIELFPNFFQTI
jgi:hypothetical protein